MYIYRYYVYAVALRACIRVRACMRYHYHAAMIERRSSIMHCNKSVGCKQFACSLLQCAAVKSQMSLSLCPSLFLSIFPARTLALAQCVPVRCSVLQQDRQLQTVCLYANGWGERSLCIYIHISKHKYICCANIDGKRFIYASDVSKCMYMYTYVCTRVCTYICIHACIYLCIFSKHVFT